MLRSTMTDPMVTEIRPALEPVVADPFVSDLSKAERPGATCEPVPGPPGEADPPSDTA